jgi:hypothetical protein
MVVHCEFADWKICKFADCFRILIIMQPSTSSGLQTGEINVVANCEPEVKLNIKSTTVRSAAADKLQEC